MNYSDTSKTYEETRREQLKELIFDYITDENTSGEALVQDIIDEVRSSHEYFSRYERKCSNLLTRLEESKSVNGKTKFGDDIDAALEYANENRYREIVKNWKEGGCKKGISQADDDDWDDFWTYVQSDAQ